MPLALRPLLSKLSIKTKTAQILPLDIVDSDFAWSQGPFIDEIERQYNAGLPVRIIVLKARQLGISTAAEGVLFNWCFIHPGTNSLVISHEDPAGQELFQMTKLLQEPDLGQGQLSRQHHSCRASPGDHHLMLGHSPLLRFRRLWFSLATTTGVLPQAASALLG